LHAIFCDPETETVANRLEIRRITLHTSSNLKGGRIVR
jgi:hypothetical protein